jgi:hypothetical protein
MHIQYEKRKKLDAKSYNGKFIGYGEEARGFLVWTRKQVKESKDIIFYESQLLKTVLVSALPPKAPADTNFEEFPDKQVEEIVEPSGSDQPSSQTIPSVLPYFSVNEFVDISQSDPISPRFTCDFQNEPASGGGR